MAADDVALQHNRLTIVYGHMTANSGRRVFSHHLRRDERSQTTPEHICTETSKNHNRFQSRLRLHHFLERDNLSHFCYSYVHVRLADGIPPRKALVMNGENVSNDVDEEVYAGDGA